MRRRTALSALSALAIQGWGRLALGKEAEELAVIVHPSSPIRSLTAEELAEVFKTRRRKVRGQRVVPFNFRARTPHRTAFDRTVLHMDPDQVARYWINRRVRGGESPPRQVPTAKVMLGVVAGLKPAVGYVPRRAVDGSVRVIARIVKGKLRPP